MKFIARLISFLPFLVGVLAAPTTTMEISREVSWPETVALLSPRHVDTEARKEGLTNQERFQQGLGPAKPKELYTEKRNLAKRLDPAPSTVFFGNRVYAFQACYAGANNSRDFTTITASSTEDAVKQCAAKTISGEQFFVGNPNGTGVPYYCVLGPTDLNAEEDCTIQNYALYAVSG